uniref:sphinganine-1-phosphate aldolase n=1 Tax=Plectus sambesii TaxID=2011161 RepID=A0A914VYY2_9BILA
MPSDLIQQTQTAIALARALINNKLESIDPLKLVATTVAATYLFCYLRYLQKSDKTLTARFKNALFYYLRKVPYVRRKVDEEVEKVKGDLHHSIHASDKSGHFFVSLPQHGLSKDELIQTAKQYEDMEGPQYLEGRVSGAVFSDEPDDQRELLKEVFGMYAWSNPLWPKVFPGCRKMEAEVIRMCCDLFRGGPKACGTMSTGGSMSILLACLAYRNRALERGIEFPEMILPTSAHAAFTKAAELFRIKIVWAKLDPVTYQVDLKAVRRAIGSRTAMIVASAPNFPYGTTDDIVAIGKLGLDYKVPVHIDACLGGFILPFARLSGYHVPPFDFSVKGVTSITADTHKYGLTPKGSSVIVYRDPQYLHYQYFCDPDWQGGIYASATFEGSRSGANIALCWATMLFHGTDNYMKTSSAVVETTRKIRDGIKKIPALRLFGSSDTCIVSFTSDKIDIHRLHDLMGKRGWQLANLQFPSGVHIMVTLNQTKPGVADAFIADIHGVVEEILASPKAQAEGPAALYGMAQKLPDRSIVKEFAYAYLDECYSTPTAMHNGTH